MTGTLFVLPVPLADADPADVLPAPVLTIAREARYLLAENARSARAFLKAAGHPGPIQQVRIVQIGHAPQPSSGWHRCSRASPTLAWYRNAGAPALRIRAPPWSPAPTIWA
jgi:16S rRNA (cytidine1402-2'-O)-methyltransferase